MHVRYIVDLTAEEREKLNTLVSGGTSRARKVKRAQLLLASADGVTDAVIAAAVRCGTSTVFRIKKRFVEEGLDAALEDRVRPGGQRKLTGRDEALLVALACSKPPTGRAHWTMKPLADEFVQLAGYGNLSRETVRRRLAEKAIKPWQEKMWCIPAVDAEFVERMEDVLATLRRRLRSGEAGRQLRREALPAHRRGPCPCPGQAGSARTRRLRVSA